ncbi:MAG TPA: hypothetical protein VH575_03060 [Gemmataceae bacterium]
MDKPVIDEQSDRGERLYGHENKSGTTAAGAGPIRSLPTYAWWLVLGLVGLDCFSTLGYLPTLAVEGASPPQIAPLAAAAVSILILFAALPVYLYIVGRSPHGQGATGLIESYTSGWGGKIVILFLLGFVATDFVMTRTLSTADASAHLLDNPHVKSGIGWIMGRKDALHHALPLELQGWVTDRIFHWWDDQLTITVILIVLGFGLFFYLLRGFTRGFMYAAAAIVVLFLVLNGLVIGSSLAYIARNPEYITNWMDLIRFGSQDRPPVDFALDLGLLIIECLPAAVLGLSGFELSMVSAPLVRGRPGDDPVRPRGRIRNARKLLVVVALLMGLFVPASVMTVALLVPGGRLQEGGAARNRALAYLAQGGTLQVPGKRVSTDQPAGDDMEVPEGDEDMAAPPPRQPIGPAKGEQQPEQPKGEQQPEQPKGENQPEQPKGENQPEQPNDEEPPEQPIVLPAGPKSTDINPLFGPAFGTLYDISAVLILCLAGASVTISLRDLLPHYLTRYGMEMHWAHRVGALLHLFNVLVLIVVIAFQARVSHQQGAYATSVLALMAAAALAAIIDLRTRWRRYFLRPLVTAPLVLIFVIFLLLACGAALKNPAGILIALLFIAVIFVTAGLSRWMRSTELRFEGFTFADEESGVRWEAIRRMEFQVLVPHRPDHLTLTEKEAKIRARHRLGPDVPIVFIEAELGDPSDFQQHPFLRIVKENGQEVIRVSQCASIAHVLAAIALEFRAVGRPPEVHFAWSEKSPLASNLNFLLWGRGNVPWMVHALIRKAEPDATLRPRVVIG